MALCRAVPFSIASRRRHVTAIRNMTGFNPKRLGKTDFERGLGQGYEMGLACGRAAEADLIEAIGEWLCHGYTVRMASEPPGQPGWPPGREPRKFRHRRAFVPDIAPAIEALIRSHWRITNELASGSAPITRRQLIDNTPPKICPNCKALFVAKRADARTCSAKCRVALSRKRRQSTK